MYLTQWREDSPCVEWRDVHGVVPTVINYGPTCTSALGNVSGAVTLAGRNATVFLEYFHNGFGVGRGNFTLTSLPPD